jgi:signal transduction histidine kinase
VLQSYALPIIGIVASLVVKLNEPQVEEPEYFDTRLIILFSSIIPLILINVRSKPLLLATSLLPSFLLLIFFDPIHNYFGVGYYQTGHNAGNYSFSPIIFLIMYLLTVGCFTYYKLLLERTEDSLENAYRESSILNKEIQSQNEELLAQADTLNEQAQALNQKQQLLQEANQLIEAQKAVLEEENANLYINLLDKNELLESSNIELQHRLQEMQQFSYTISHNLRGPVASIMGLFNLFDRENALPANSEIVSMAQVSVNALDQVVHDLTRVLELRDNNQLSEPVNLVKLIENILVSLRQILENTNAQTQMDLKVTSVYGVKSYLHSILYNLISNAIKYRQSDARPEVRIRSYREGNYVMLQVEDNGQGIDLSRHHHNLFKMYKRFSGNREGRGLGLYLVKTQAELLGGTVEVESTVGQGSTFTISVPVK